MTAPEPMSERARLANLIHDDQREQCDLDPEGFYDCEQLADRIIAAGFARSSSPVAATWVTEDMVEAAINCEPVDYAELRKMINEGSQPSDVERVWMKRRIEAALKAAAERGDG